MAKPLAQASHFDAIAPAYEGSLPAHVVWHYVLKRIRFIQRLIPLGSIVDIGCGIATLLDALGKYGYRVVGADVSLEMLKRAHEKEFHSVVLASGDALPYRSDSFDAAISIATFHHLIDPLLVKNTLSEMLRVTKPGGTVLIWDHNPLNPYWKLLMRRVPQDRGDERLVWPRELIAAAEARGVERSCISLYRRGFVPDFAPAPLMPIFACIERIVEVVPVLALYAAHNVVAIRKAR